MTRPESNSASGSPATSSGWVTGVRFYKSTANIGTHTGTLWTASGTQLASGHVQRRDGFGVADPAIRRTGGDHEGHHVRRELLRARAATTRTSEYYFWNGKGDSAPLHPVENSPTDPTQVNGVYASGDALPEPVLPRL